LREIPGELRQDVRMKGQLVRPPAWAGGSRQQAQADGVGYGAAEEGGLILNLGQRVRHPTFGEGVVLNAEGQGTKARVQINFDDAGGKWLVMAYARLEVIG
jgi:DNA helicase-2/ATP-dependent DNA helicase PcrA